MNIYLKLTQEFNARGLRAIISSGQAVVLHKLAIMSKDGDWIIREDSETTDHIIDVLSSYGAHYRFGAPLDIKWLRYGWSSHFEFIYENLRVRTDFVTRPPRVNEERLKFLWFEKPDSDMPFVNLMDLAELKKTNREKDFAVIGELARQMKNVSDQLLFSRSAKDIASIYREAPEVVNRLISQRPVLAEAGKDIQVLESALDAERRQLMHKNEDRLIRYMEASEKWKNIWFEVDKEIEGMGLKKAHSIIVKKAEGVLPFEP